MGLTFERTDGGEIVHDTDGLPVVGTTEPIGNQEDDWSAGLTNTVRWKNLIVEALLDVNWGADLYSLTNAQAYGTGRHEDTLPGREQGYVIGDGVIVTERNEDGEIVETRENDVPVDPEDYYGFVGGNIAEPFVYDGSYVRLRQLRLSYSLPESVLNVANGAVQSAQISLTGRNLWLIYDNVPNVDPSASYSTGTDHGLDTDRFAGDTPLLEKTLTYHVLPNAVRAADLTDGMTATTLQGDDVQIRLPDSGPMVNKAALVTTDIPTRNGVIHLIDGPLLEASTVGERIDLASKYSVLEQLLRDTGRRSLLDETDGTLPGEAPFTVFAPTNAAFDALDTSGLSSSEIGDLLDYHLVTNTTIMSGDISNGQRVEIREGSELFFGLSDGTVMINNDATVTVPDQRSTQNGVVHEIDRVLTPPSGN